MQKKATQLIQKNTASGAITVWQNQTQRWLCLNDVEQSRVYIDPPDKVALPLHESFLAFLLLALQEN